VKDHISEIYLLKNKKLEKVYSFQGLLFNSSYGREFRGTGLKDGGILVHHAMSKNYIKADQQYYDLLFIDKYKNIEFDRMEPFNTDTALYALNSAYAISRNEFYLAHAYYTLTGEYKDYLWFTGLAKYENGNWKVYDKSSGLPNQPELGDSVMAPIFEVVKVEEKLYARNSDTYYVSTDDKTFKKFDIKPYFEKMTFYNRSENDDDDVADFLNLAIREEEDFYPKLTKFSNVKIYEDGTLMVNHPFYIGFTSIKAPANVNSNNEKDQALLNPNPVVQNLYLNESDANTKLIIYDSSGKQVINTYYSAAGIDCSYLPKGSYNVFIIQNKKINFSKFVK